MMSVTVAAEAATYDETGVAAPAFESAGDTTAEHLADIEMSAAVPAFGADPAALGVDGVRAAVQLSMLTRY